MGTLVVVPADPASDHPLCLFEVSEQALPHTLLLEGPEEPLDDAVLLRDVAIDDGHQIAPAVGAAIDVGHTSMARSARCSSRRGLMRPLAGVGVSRDAHVRTSLLASRCGRRLSCLR